MVKWFFLCVLVVMLNLLEVSVLFGCEVCIVDDMLFVVCDLLVFGFCVVLFKGGYLVVMFNVGEDGVL